jgi:hypothetical protein
MKYDKIFFNTSRLWPKAMYVLNNIPDTYYFGGKHPHPCRPATGIYNIAAYEFLSSLETAIEKYENYIPVDDIVILNADNENFFRELVEKCEKIIANICSFYDECFLIFISMSEPSMNNPIVAFDWLKSNGYDTGSIFKNYSFEAIKFWQEINNRLKHNNQKLSFILASEGVNHVEGFFIEGYTSVNSIGFDPTFHGKKNNMSDGISFKKFFKEVFLSFFYISDMLLKAVEQHLKKYHNYKLNYRISSNGDEDRIKNIWNKLSDMDYIYFPDEYKIKYTKIGRYKISYLHKTVFFSPIPGKLKLKMAFSGDGVTNKISCPMYQ